MRSEQEEKEEKRKKTQINADISKVERIDIDNHKGILFFLLCKQQQIERMYEKI